METAVETMSSGLALTPLFEIALYIAVIGIIGLFLWNKGRFSISPKR